MSWKTSVNQAPQSAKINDIKHYYFQDSASISSPIDTFYKFTHEYLRIGDINFLSTYPHIGNLLLVGLVSSTENYFRDILSNIINICPISQSESADESIMLGSVVWHDPVNVFRGAFEHFSFTSSSNIVKTCQKFTGIQLTKCSGILKEYDKVCELRHGIVHAGSCVPGKNAIKLQIPSYSGTLRIKFDFNELHEAGSICTNVVTSINQELFEKLSDRWADGWRKLGSWNPAEEDQMFEIIWKMFFSQNDSSKSLITNPLTLNDCKNSIRVDYGL